MNSESTQGQQVYDKNRKLKILLYHREDKKLQEEQNRILRVNTALAWVATIAGIGAFLAQVIQVIVDIILQKYGK